MREKIYMFVRGVYYFFIFQCVIFALACSFYVAMKFISSGQENYTNTEESYVQFLIKENDLLIQENENLEQLFSNCKSDLDYYQKTSSYCK